jgi:hypothetical protein
LSLQHRQHQQQQQLLFLRSTMNQSDNYLPILAAVLFDLVVFACCPFTRTSIRPVDAGI